MFDRTDPAYPAYIRILEAELIPATGCTEPIAIAYGAAKVRQALGALPEKCRVECSGNIIKNVKSVVVPNTGYLRGIEAAAAAGLVAGDADVELQVISHVAEKDRTAIREYRDSHPIEVVPYPGDKVFYIAITAWAGARQTRDAVSNQLTTAQAVTDCKLTQLTAEVRRHNEFARRLPVVEEQVRSLTRRMEEQL